MQADEECFAHFARMGSWTGQEAVCLLLKLDPRKALESASFRDRGFPAQRHPKFADLALLITRADQLLGSPDCYHPQVMLEWAEFHDLDVPSALRQNVEKYKGPLQPWDPDEGQFAERKPTSCLTGPPRHESSEDDDLNPKERDSLYRLVIAIAMEQYGYDPKAERNQATANIESDLRTVGVPLDRNTILKWLRKAAEVLPPQE